MTYRYFLQDAAFACALTVPEAQAEDLGAALQNPVWDIFLGRKCCVPTDSVFRGLFPNEEKALEEAARLAAEKQRAEDFRVLDGAFENEGEVLLLNDVPVCFGQYKVYRDRRVTVVTPCP